MARLVFANFVLLSVVSGGLTLTINDLLGFGNLRQIQQEEPRVVEVIRWRQPVCLTAAPGVPPCMVGFGNQQPQPNVQAQGQNSHYSKRAPDDDLVKKLTRDESLGDKSSLESLEDDLLGGRSTREASTPKLFSPRIVKSVQFENLGSSSLQGPTYEGPRRGRYLRLAPQMSRSTARKQTVYVTKVVDSPVMANLVAGTCLPDIGIPLCDETQSSHQNPAGSYQNPSSSHYAYPGNYGTANPAPVPAAQPTYGNPTSTGPTYPWNYDNNSYNNNGQYQQYQQQPQPQPQYQQYQQQPQYQQYQQQPQSQPQPQQSTQAPPPQLIQNIVDFLSPPNIVHTNQTPDLKPVVVVQPAPPPGFFDGINAFLMPNGSFLGVFNRPADNSTGGFPGLPQLPQLPQFPTLPPLPQVPTLQEILYRPENDISRPPQILNVFNLTNNQPGAGPTTQSPGIFGGLFTSPAQPAGYYTPTTTTPATTSTSTTVPSILDNINNIFRPTNKPLIIETPNQRPIIVERPVYVAELPVVPGLFDILQNMNRPAQVNPGEEPQVIKDPVYVLQKPNEGPQLFGIALPNFNLFGTSSTTTTSTTTPAPIHHEPAYQYPGQPDYSQLPSFPNPPHVSPGIVTQNPPSYGHSKSTDAASSQTSSVAVDAVEVSSASELTAEVHEEKSQTTGETILEENDALAGSMTEIVNAEGETTATGINDESSYVVEDDSDASLTTEDNSYREYKSLDSPAGIKQQIDNEA